MSGTRPSSIAFAILANLLLLGGLLAGQEDSRPGSGDRPGTPAPALPGAQSSPGRILFASNRSGPWRLWTVQPDGRGLKQLLENKNGEEQDVDAVFAADGKSILFTSTRGGTPGLWRVGAEGGEPQRICDGDQGEPSPDGKRLAFRKKNRVQVRELATGTEQQVVPDDFANCSGPAWSPDGKTLAFACRWAAGNGIFTVPADGSAKPFKVYDKKGACEPHYSPDGKLLVYETETNIGLIQPDGKENRLVTYFGGVQRYARFSPDGKTLVYCQGVSEKGPWVLNLIPAEGGDPTPLTEGGSDMLPDWK